MREDEKMSNDNKISQSCADLDLEALFNIREWVRMALEAEGAKVVGAGIGVDPNQPLGLADIQFQIDGCEFNLTVRPVPLYQP